MGRNKNHKGGSVDHSEYSARFFLFVVETVAIYNREIKDNF